MIQRKGGGGRTMMIVAIVIVVIIILVVAVGYEAGWFKSSSSTAAVKNCTLAGSPVSGSLPAAGSLKGEGSTLVAPLVDQWATSYWTGSIVTYDSAGSSSGIQAITTKTVDFGASDAPLNPAQRAAAPGILQLPEAAGGVVPIYNLAAFGLKAPLNFNGSVLAQIFDGKITLWNDSAIRALNPGVWVNASIEPVYRTGGSGTTFIFTSFLTLENAYWATTYGKNLAWPSGLPGVGESGNGGVATFVGITADTIGYVDLNYALNSASGVGVGDVENPSGHFIRASVADTESALEDLSPTLPAGSGDWYNVSFLNAPGAGDYPITSLTYLLIYQNLTGFMSYTAASAENLVDFLQWAITTGQTWSGDLYYAPLPASVVSVDDATINSMTFDGSAILDCVPAGGGAPT